MYKLIKTIRNVLFPISSKKKINVALDFSEEKYLSCREKFFVLFQDVKVKIISEEKIKKFLEREEKKFYISPRIIRKNYLSTVTLYEVNSPVYNDFYFKKKNKTKSLNLIEFIIVFVQHIDFFYFQEYTSQYCYFYLINGEEVTYEISFAFGSGANEKKEKEILGFDIREFTQVKENENAKKFLIFVS